MASGKGEKELGGRERGFKMPIFLFLPLPPLFPGWGKREKKRNITTATLLLLPLPSRNRGENGGGLSDFPFFQPAQPILKQLKCNFFYDFIWRQAWVALLV